MFFNVLLSLAIALAVFVIIWLLRGIILTPVPKGKNMAMRVVIEVSGEAFELENTVDALLWLRNNGTLDAEIEVRDSGMGEETAKVAQLLKRSGIIEINDRGTYGIK